MEWLPGTGEMNLLAAPTSLYALGMTILVLLTALLGTRGRFRRPYIEAGLAALALIGATLAFLAGHFLLRYVALEVAALCVALAPLLASAGPSGDAGDRQMSLAVYLVLRIGDAGLLAAILALYGAVGTLDIDAALAAGQGLPLPRLGWIAAGFALAVWVKVGLWPFSLWLHAGRRLGGVSRAWLYLVLMPNLGLYLLYKVSPLLAAAGPAQMAVMWVGAACAVISALLAIFQRDWASGEIVLWSTQGGLILWVAALGLKSPVWVSLILWTPLRLLSVWALDLARAQTRAGRLVGAGALAACGVVWTAWGGLILVWARPAAEMSGAAATWILAQLTLLLILIWVGRAMWRLWRAASIDTGPAAASSPYMWAVGGLGIAVLAALALARPLLDHLFAVAHAGMPAWPGLLAWLGAMFWTPALPLAVLAAWGMNALGKRQRAILPDRVADVAAQTSLNLALGVRVVVEWGLLEGVVSLASRAVMGISAWLHRWLEMGGLEGSLRRLVQFFEQASDWSLRRLEMGGLEGFLRWLVERVRSAARGVQRLHTGRLRANLIWVVLGLIVMTLALVFLVR